jgi:ribosomal protein S18 acetylase RimI-like enzyme
MTFRMSTVVRKDGTVTLRSRLHVEGDLPSLQAATVEHAADNLPALKLYRSLGFDKRFETLGYRR